MLRNLLCVFLSGSLVLSTSCGVQKKSSNQDPAPSPAASTEQIQETQTVMAQESESPTEFALQSSKLDGLINQMIASGNMAIKDQRGADVAFEKYKLNPTQYFLLLKEDSSSSKYQALKASTTADLSNVADLIKNGSVELQFDVFDVDGNTAEFSSANLSEATISETVSLSTTGSIVGNLQNISKMKSLLNRVSDASKIAYAPSTLDKVENFLFPKAFAASYKDKLLTTAIIFTSISVLSYIFGYFHIGNMTAVGGIVFWLLYAFE